MHEVSIEQFLRDVGDSPDVPLGAKTVRIDGHNDPLESLTHPLAQYGARTFFYAGFLYAMCRLDASITERFRADTGVNVTTRLHRFDHPLVAVHGCPDFQRAVPARTLQSVLGDGAARLLEYIASQVIVDRRRQLVWRVGTAAMTIPDPWTVDARGLPVAVDVLAFLPRRYDVRYDFLPAEPLATPTLAGFKGLDLALQTETKAILGGSHV